MPLSNQPPSLVADPLRASVDQLLEGVQILGRDWTYLYLNEAAARHGQRRVDDLLGRTMLDCYPNIEETVLFERLRRVMIDRVPDAFSNEFVFPDGTRQRFDLRVGPVPDGISILSLDVTGWHQLETELRENQERTEFALRAGQMGVWQLHLGTGEMSWSETMADLGGVPRGQGPKTVAEFLDWVEPEDRAKVGAAVTAAALSQAEFAVQFRVNRADGKQRWMEAHARVTTDAAGRPEVLTGVGLDITERRSTERQLQLAQKMEAVGRLAGGIAHDFNNQLAVILGFTDLVLETTDPNSPTAQDLQEVRNAGERAKALTRQLLAFSRRQVLKIEPLDLNDAVTNVGRLLTRLLGADVLTELALDAAVPMIQADAGQIEQVLTNLAVNARDAMPAGGRLTISTSCVELTHADVRQNVVMQPGRYTVLAVTDTGHGMSEATQAHIFEPFFTTKDAGKGTGLGLSTVYGIIKQMGGFIWVYSEVGRGTTFRLYFPSTESVPDAPAAAVKTSLPQGRGTVLVIEDEPSLRLFTVRALKAHGYTVLEAGSADEAAVVLDEFESSIDLVLSDVVLPGQSGPELMASRPRQLRTLFMSGYSAQHVRNSVFAGEMQLLQKPFSVHDLLTRVHQALVASSGS